MGKIRHERQKYHISASGDDVTMDDGPVPQLVVPKPGGFIESENIFAGIDIKLDTINKLSKPDSVADADAGIAKSSQSGPYKRSAKPDVNSIAAKPTQASNQRPERQQTKKQKRDFKHTKLMEKINVVQQARRRAKEKQQKKSKKGTPTIAEASPIAASAELATLKATFGAPKKTVPVIRKFSTSLKTLEDALLSLNDSLPSLDTVLKLKSSGAKTGLTKDEIDGAKKLGNKKKKNSGQHFVQGKVSTNTNKTRINKSKEMIKRFNHMQKLLSDENYKKNPRAVIAQHVSDKAKIRNRR